MVMEEEFEEFEPLFNYTRVQPTNYVLVEDDSPQNSPKRRKTNNEKSKVVGRGGGYNSKVINPSQIIDCDDDDEDDEEFWLPPPPKMTDTVSKLEEDSTIKEIRLKKKELQLLAQSTIEVLRASEEATKRVAEEASLSEAEAVKDEPWTFSKGKGNGDGYLDHTDKQKNSVQPTSVRAKIVISIQDQAEIKQFRVFADEKFEGIFQKYAERVKLDVHKLVFTFDGDKVDPTSTPQRLGMEDDDIIEANVKTR